MNTSILGDPESKHNIGKYESQNFIAQKLIEAFTGQVLRMVSEIEPARVVDLGCGEGVIAQKLHENFPSMNYLGVDYSEMMLNQARKLNPSLEFVKDDLMHFQPTEANGDVFLCLEVLEHLRDPNALLSRIASFKMKAVLISVPWEPFFQLGNLFRGKYLSRWGNHPGHVQHFTPKSLESLASCYFKEVKIVRSFPWIIAVLYNPELRFRITRL
jgi:2-polyprenyl-3-methyl-5-hydroxy-6-metoxy-1,4-benzoquinol methylase